MPDGHQVGYSTTEKSPKQPTKFSISTHTDSALSKQLWRMIFFTKCPVPACSLNFSSLRLPWGFSWAIRFTCNIRHYRVHVFLPGQTMWPLPGSQEAEAACWQTARATQEQAHSSSSTFWKETVSSPQFILPQLVQEVSSGCSQIKGVVCCGLRSGGAMWYSFSSIPRHLPAGRQIRHLVAFLGSSDLLRSHPEDSLYSEQKQIPLCQTLCATYFSFITVISDCQHIVFKRQQQSIFNLQKCQTD